jgi:hypothetical protein
MKTKSQKQKSGLKSRTEQLNTKQLPKIDFAAPEPAITVMMPDED